MAAKATPEELAAANALEAALQEEAANAPETVAGNAPDETPPVITTPDSTAPKRKRGRPSEAERALRESLGQVVDGDGTKPAGAKRGPKPKGKNSDPSTLAKSLVGIHQLAAMLTRIPEAQLSEAEGQALAEGVIAVCEEYGLSIDGKTGAAMQLFGAAAMIYGPRVWSYKMRMAAEERAAREAFEAANKNVHPMSGAFNGGQSFAPGN